MQYTFGEGLSNERILEGMVKPFAS